MKSKLSLTSNRAFYAFLILTLVISLVLSALFVGLRANVIVEDLVKETNETQAQLAVNNLTLYLESRKQVLTDLSSHSIVVNGAMGTGLSAAKLQDFLRDFQIIGKEEKLLVINVLGEVVYANFDHHEVLDAKPQWLDKVINADIASAIDLTEVGNQHYFTVAVPIYYNGFAEGALIGELSTSLESLLSVSMDHRFHNISLTGRWVNFSDTTNPEDFFSIESLDIGTTGLRLDYRIEKRLITDEVAGFVWDLVGAIAFGLLISFGLLLLFGRQLLLNPFKKLEESKRTLERSEERFKLAIVGSDDGLWDWDLERNAVFYSDRFKSLLGFTQENKALFSAHISSLFDRVHPEDLANLEKSIHYHMTEEEPFGIECRIKTRQNNYRYYWLKGASALKDNKAKRIVGSLSDITEQKLRQEALRKAKEQNDLLAQAIECANVGITIADANKPELPIVFANKTFEHITGYGKEVLGKNCRVLQGEKTQPQALDQIRAAIINHEFVKVELINYTKSGKAFWNSLQISPVFNKDNQLTAFVGIQQDISAAVEAKKELELAKHQAEQGAKAKSEFLASMSHEIRTPMNGVIGMLSLLEDEHLTQTQLHKVSLAMGSAKSLLNLINDILDFSKIEAGKLELEQLDFDVRSLLGELVESVALQAQKKGLEIVLDVTQINEPVVKGDPSRLRQVLTNLISNAIKFTEQGEIIIRAWFDKTQEPLRFFCTVEDTGIGIPADKADRLFTKFSQVDASTTRKYGGTGLGLAIVKQLCELMGGDISVQSRLGYGSEFTFFISLTPSDNAELNTSEINLAGIKILLVDDSLSTLSTLESQLELWGAEVYKANSGIQALSLCESEYQKDKTVFDIALLDMTLRGMSGEQLGEALKNDKRWQSMKLIMMTQMGAKGDGQYYAERGYSGYFPKPVTTKDLFDALTILAEDGQTLAQAKPLVTSHYLKLVRKTTDTPLKWPTPCRILLVEDNKVNQVVALSMLKKLGIEAVTVAENGLLAIELLKSSHGECQFELILMDCQMPEMDGYRTTELIREGEAGDVYRALTVIAMTANAMTGDREKCLNAGMNDYLTKPISQEPLSTKLQYWLYKSIYLANDDKEGTT
ncbi:PAS domain-containing hybrid sensor histidine kinase/response regulator [Pseudoalteromonas piscicida]|uniref:Sensory/regulatory protein RpfC n=1 Tax=Pseudoalteromonas piscicida TaxID=43662 RepID=A0A2A5JPF8_PSEO7|nr:PAS domain-containing hybrid sensor histidine kinase/response regulator [Pseudoalteromonas piscicida]PCK31333.1 hybrid sensor histidine kinase/response regulator [Pseudoalteromonas piscicida]